MKEFIAKRVQQLKFICNNFSIILWFWLSVADLKRGISKGRLSFSNFDVTKTFNRSLEAMLLKKKYCYNTFSSIFISLSKNNKTQCIPFNLYNLSLIFNIHILASTITFTI